MMNTDLFIIVTSLTMLACAWAICSGKLKENEQLLSPVALMRCWSLHFQLLFLSGEKTLLTHVMANGSPSLVNVFIIAQLPFMALFCLNVRGQFHARPGMGTERKHLAWQLVGKGCLTLKLDIQMLPWLGSLDWCSPRVWEAVKNWTVCPSHRLPFSSKKLLFPPLSPFLPQGFCRGRTRMTTEMCVCREPLWMGWVWRDPEAMFHWNLQVGCVTVSLSSASAIAIVLLHCPCRWNTRFQLISQLPGSIKQLLY